MTKDEALKMAIDTLQNAKRRHFYCEDTYYSCPKHEDECADDRQPYKCNCGADELNAEIEISINACKEALEQPTQVPVAHIKQGGSGYPVLVFNRRFEYESITAKQPDIPLYTHPKEWQKLSDDEIWNIANFLGKNKEWDYPVMFAKTIEQALKEKNT